MWIARDKTNVLCLYNTKPVKDEHGNWDSNPNGDVEKDWDYHYQCLQIDENLYPYLTWEDEPIEVELWSKDYWSRTIDDIISMYTVKRNSGDYASDLEIKKSIIDFYTNG